MRKLARLDHHHCKGAFATSRDQARHHGSQESAWCKTRLSWIRRESARLLIRHVPAVDECVSGEETEMRCHAGRTRSEGRAPFCQLFSQVRPAVLESCDASRSQRDSTSVSCLRSQSEPDSGANHVAYLGTEVIVRRQDLMNFQDILYQQGQVQSLVQDLFSML